MASLTAYFVSKSLERLNQDLTPGFQKLAKELVELLDREGRARVADIHQRLFSANTPQSANAALSRLVNTINRAAEGRKVPLRAMVTADKKAGASKRWVWFEGSASAGVSPLMSELNAIPRDRLVENQRGMPLDAAPVVVLITANEHESRAVLSHFHPAGPPPVRTIDGMTYNELGLHGGMRVVHRVCKQGQAEFQSATQDAVHALQPRAIIAVGIAFGVNPSVQRIGDVLVSEFVRAYELGRVGANGVIAPRGGKQQASSCLYQRVLLLDHRQKADSDASLLWPELRFGTLLSGDKLVDNLNYRNSLLQLEPEAIGGEMEGVGLHIGADRHKVDWLIVKAICDWADGNKHSPSKSADQALAADNAAQVVKRALELGNLYDDGPGASEPADRGPGDGTTPLLDQAPLWHPSTSQMGFSDLGGIPDARRVHDAQGRPTTLQKDHADDLDSDRGESVEVLSYIMQWIDEVGGPPVFALLGEYGMGKTVTCQRVARALDERQQLDPTKPIPLYFDLRLVTGLDRRVPTLQETLEECMRRGWAQAETHLDYSMESVFAWIRHGAVIIVDGLDEVLVKLKEPDGQVFTNALLKLLIDAQAQAHGSRGPALKMLISCRTHYFRTLRDQKNHFTGQERGENDADSFRALVLLPFSEQQILNYLTQAVPDIESERLIDIVRSVHNLEELTQRPYTLRLVAEFIPEIERDRLAGRIVHGVTLYRRMAQRWLERDSGKHHIRPNHKLRLAAHLAAYLWRGGHGVLPANELEAWFHEWLESQPDLVRRYGQLHPDQLEEDLRTATFLTRQDDRLRSAFRFAHTSLMEFFLAEYLLDAVRTDQPDAWAMRVPTYETMKFFGQLLAEADDPALLDTLQKWCGMSRPQTSELLFRYALAAQDEGWPSPTLRGMQLSGARLPRCSVGSRSDDSDRATAWIDLDSVDFTDADLREAHFERVRMKGASFRGAKLEGATFVNCHLEYGVFSSAVVSRAVLRHCTMDRTDWSDAVLYRTQFLHCMPSAAVPASHGDGVRHAVPVLRVEHPPATVAPQDCTLYAQCGWLMNLNACAISPNNRYVAAGGDQGTTWIWDAVSGEMLYALAVPGSWLDSCTFSPDSRCLAISGGGGTIRLWDVAKGELLRTLTSDTAVTSCAFSPDGRRLVSGGFDHGVRMWDTSSGDLLNVLPTSDESARCCAFSADGGLVVSGGDEGTVRVWDAASGDVLAAFSDERGAVVACGFSPNSRLVVACSDDGTVQVWDLSRGDVLQTFELRKRRRRSKTATGRRGSSRIPRRDRVRSCVLSADCRYVAILTGDGVVRVWDVPTSRSLYAIPGIGPACAFSPDGRWLATARSSAVWLFDAKDGEWRRTMACEYASVNSCSVSRDGCHIASVNEDGVLFWDMTTGELRREFQESGGWTESCAFSPDGRLMATGGDDGGVSIWDITRGEIVQTLLGDGGWVLSCAFSPDGRWLASSGSDATVRLWDVASGSALHTLTGLGAWVHSCAFSADGRYLAAGSSDGQVRIWDPLSGRLSHALENAGGGVLMCRFLPDGEHMMIGTTDGSISTWSVATGQVVLTRLADRVEVRVCAFSPDFLRTAMGGTGGALWLWDRVTNASRALLGHHGTVLGCAFSPDGRYVVSCGNDATIRLWDGNNGACLRVHVSARDGRAVWIPDENRIIETDGDAWRWLVWQTRDAAGDPTVLPAETFGSLTPPRLGGAGPESGG